MSNLSERGTRNVGVYVGHLPISLTEVVDDSQWIDLSFAENYTTRSEVLEILREAVGTQVTEKDLNWPHGFWGEAGLLVALSSLFNSYFAPSLAVEKSNIVLTAGAAGALDGVVWSVCDSGEGILVPCPYHAGAYEVFMNIHTGVVPIPVPVNSLEDVFGKGMIPTLEKGFRDAKVPIKAVVVINPHNPLGRCYSKESLIEIIELGSEDLRQPRKFTSVLAIDAAAHGCDANRIHVIWSMSKDLGATGARLGCVVTRNKDMRDSIALVSHTSVSSFSVMFARALLTSPRLHTIIQLNSSRLATAYARLVKFFELNSIQYLPCEATTFVLARLAPYNQTREDERAAVAFYQSKGILFFSAADYHMPSGLKGWMRVSFAVVPEKLGIALDRLKLAYDLYMERASAEESISVKSLNDAVVY
ncbi:hypothetical protein O1611_g1306 [Lasiodiplodia mahajangana]|uniref:Uncharacterized protein n=1 Tax=Lasiodiplodia mahajangana TaxID=1108764 RepID=A0ACC2JXY1_9PEZI|nr:hypothetical protein O1611_g1306 [Lasiodiplodia mahajangana]